jgi:hypothetical protein
MFLMLTSVEPSIGSTLLHLRSAKAIWECLQHVYLGAENVTSCMKYASNTLALNKALRVWRSIILKS